MTDEFRLPADDQPVLEGEPLPELIPGGQPAVYEVDPTPPADTPIEVAPPQPGEADRLTLSGLLRAVFGLHETAEGRIAELSQMIDVYPEAPANYVLRGELLLKTGAYEQAADDFQQALNIASEQTATADWGLVAQAVQDRAFDGLEKSQRLLRRTQNGDAGVSR